MKCHYSVSFEFEIRPPSTFTGVVEGFTAGTCARRAVEEAQKVLKPINWTSLVCVLLDRVEDPDESVKEMTEGI
jgi:hypothetical protein